jgi:hypothetical protein
MASAPRAPEIGGFDVVVAVHIEDPVRQGKFIELMDNQKSRFKLAGLDHEPAECGIGSIGFETRRGIRTSGAIHDLIGPPHPDCPAVARPFVAVPDHQPGIALFRVLAQR